MYGGAVYILITMSLKIAYIRSIYRTNRSDADSLHPIPRRIRVTKKLHNGNQHTAAQGLRCDKVATHLIAYAGIVAHIYIIPVIQNK